MRWIILGALALVVLIPFLQPDLISRFAPALLYFPARLGREQAKPEAWGLEGAEQVRLETEDGLALHAWWIPAAASSAGHARARGAAVYFHGNAGHLAGRAPIADRLRGLGVHVLLFDYRGYGLSEGRPSETGLYRDGMAAYRHVRDVRGVPAERILLVGHSLGAAIAAWVAAREPTGGLVVSSTFRNLPSMARSVYRWLPGRLFAWKHNRFDTEARMKDIDAPVLVAWGGADEFVPRAQTRALYDAAAGPKRWVEVEGAGHNDLWWEPGFWSELGTFVGEVMPADD